MDRYLRLFDADSDWRRPLPTGWLHTDAVVALTALALSAFSLELLRSIGVLGTDQPADWVQYLVLGSAAALLLIRRRFPVLAGVAATVHLLVAGMAAPGVAGQLVQQVVYFVAVYSSVAWGRNRRTVAGACALITALLVLWSIWYFALGQGLQVIADSQAELANPSRGVLDPIPATLLYYALSNCIFFFGAIALGVDGWRSARRHALTGHQAATIARQADELRRGAVVDERLRLARELHDVVAHHVAGMGVQAAAARRQMTRDPGRAADALLAVEDASREAVTEMRSLLGALRRAPTEHDELPAAPSGRHPDRHPEPCLADLPDLVARSREPRFDIDLQVVEAPGLPVSEVPASIWLSLYRTTQEALTNVRRHSTAGSARVVVRTGSGEPAATGGGHGFAEVEVLDDGRPRPGTSGSGLGLLGMRERVASHRGTCEIGPRVTGGYRVRVRIPIREHR